MLPELRAAIPFELVLSVEFGPPLLAQPVFTADAPWLRGLARALASMKGHERNRDDVIVRIVLKSPAGLADKDLSPGETSDRLVDGVVAAFTVAGWATRPANVTIREHLYEGTVPSLEVAVYAASADG